MANTAVYISTNEVVRISDPYVIFYQLTPKSISWDNSAQSAYYMVNSTGSDIPFTDGSFYYDANSVLTTKLIAGSSLFIVKNNLNNWLQNISPNDISVVTGSDTNTSIVPIATNSILGIVKIGANLNITIDGLLSAVIPPSGTVDWNDILNKPTFSTVAFSGSYNDLLGKPSLATVATTGNFNDLTNKPTPLSLTTTGTTGPATLVGSVLNIPQYSGGGGGSITLTTVGTSGPASLVGTALNVPNYTYTLPIATVSVLGGVKPDGSTIIIDGSGVISVPGGGSITLTTLGTSGVATLVGTTLNVPNYTSGSAITTCMPLASTVGILANGSDMTTLINTVLANSAYCGIIFDYGSTGNVVVNGTIAGNGKVLSFRQGNFISGSGTINNFVLDSGLRQKCFDIGPSGAPTLTVNPIGTTMSVISPWAFGATGNGSTDDARAFQCTIDCVLRNPGKINKILVPTTRYKIGSPLIVARWNISTYVFVTCIIEGENTFASADGTGTQLDFSSRKDSFFIGCHQAKGFTIKNIKFIGGFSYAMPLPYVFYSQNFTAITDGVSRDTAFSPNAAVVIDPFSPTIPSDGGYPGNDAYGVALSTYYRGNNNGSTGIELEDIFITNVVIGVITSPNGHTNNADVVNIWKIQLANVKIGFVGCQAQEKLNTVRHVMSWGFCGCVFATGLYGAQSIGSWWVEDVNIAGLSHTFCYNLQSGYFPSYFGNIYAETLGRVGTINSNNATTIRNSTFNFAYYNSEALSYINGMITGQGCTFMGCQFRLYGTGLPITVAATNGQIFFRDCSFETVPFYNQDYSAGFCSFSNCNIGGAGNILNPPDMQTATSPNFSGLYAYGNNKINIGSTFFSTRKWNISSQVAAARLPINTTLASYTITPTLVGGAYYQAVITCPGDELTRVFVGDVIVVDQNGTGGSIKVAGVVTAAGGGTFTISYLSSDIVAAANYKLYVWLPLKNIAFTGDVTIGSAQITNVTLIDGSLVNFANTGLRATYGGFLITKTFKATDTWAQHTFRALNWNAGTSTLTLDKNSTINGTKLLFTNVDIVPDPGTPTIVAGAAAGAAPTVSITKGTDIAMQVSVTTGLSTVTGIVATISFSLPFTAGRVPTVSFSPANGNAAILTGTNQVYMDAAVPSSFTINTGSTPLATNTTYLWNVEVQ